MGRSCFGGILLGIRGAAEGVQIYRGAAPESFTEIVPLAHIVAQFAGHQTALEQAVQLYAHFFCPGPGGTVEIALVAEDHKGIAGDIVHGGGHFRVDQGHVAVGCRVAHTVFVLFQIPFQSLN